MDEGLKLYALDADDITIMSAALEGAITSPGEMSYSAAARQFTFTASRLMWEKKADSTPTSKRIRCGILITDVLSVKASAISQTDKTAMLELLSITAQEEADGAAKLSLAFAGGGTLILTVECTNAALTDVGDAWETDKTPMHALDD